MESRRSVLFNSWLLLGAATAALNGQTRITDLVDNFVAPSTKILRGCNSFNETTKENVPFTLVRITASPDDGNGLPHTHGPAPKPNAALFATNSFGGTSVLYGISDFNGNYLFNILTPAFAGNIKITCESPFASPGEATLKVGIAGMTQISRNKYATLPPDDFKHGGNVSYLYRGVASIAGGLSGVVVIKHPGSTFAITRAALVWGGARDDLQAWVADKDSHADGLAFDFTFTGIPIMDIDAEFSSSGCFVSNNGIGTFHSQCVSDFTPNIPLRNPLPGPPIVPGRPN